MRCSTDLLRRLRWLHRQLRTDLEHLIAELSAEMLTAAEELGPGAAPDQRVAVGQVVLP